MMSEPSVCIVLPMYNEAANAEATVVSIAGYLEANVTDRKWAIAVTNDGSKDDTGKILMSLAETRPYLQVTNHPVNMGYGAATRSSMQKAYDLGFDYALVMDADGTQDPMYISRFFEPMKRGVGMIKATRYALGGGTQGVPFARRVNSWGGNKLAKLVLRLPLTDYTNGFRAIHRDILGKLKTKENGFAMLVEEVSQAKRLGATFEEVPYILTARTAPGSKSKFVYSWKMYKSYLKQLG